MLQTLRVSNGYCQLKIQTWPQINSKFIERYKRWEKRSHQTGLVISQQWKIERCLGWFVKALLSKRTSPSCDEREESGNSIARFHQPYGWKREGRLNRFPRFCSILLRHQCSSACRKGSILYWARSKDLEHFTKSCLSCRWLFSKVRGHSFWKN